MKQREIRFGEWCYLPDTLELCRGSVRQAVEPRVARLLEYMLEHPGELLSHDRLIATVWDGRVVSDEAVRRAVSALRRVLGTREGGGIVRTIHKKGYLAVFPPPPQADCAPEPEPAPRQPETPDPAPAPRQSRLRTQRQDIVVATVLGVVCLLALALGPRLPDRMPPPVAAERSAAFTLAVLPFANHAANGAADEALAAELRGALALNPVFAIADRVPASKLEGRRHDPRTIGTRLGVRYVLDGSIGHGSARVQVLAQLFDTATGTAVWSGSYERAPTELGALPQAIATDIARALKVVLVSSDGARRQRAPVRI